LAVSGGEFNDGRRDTALMTLPVLPATAASLSKAIDDGRRCGSIGGDEIGSEIAIYIVVRGGLGSRRRHPLDNRATIRTFVCPDYSSKSIGPICCRFLAQQQDEPVEFER